MFQTLTTKKMNKENFKKVIDLIEANTDRFKHWFTNKEFHAFARKVSGANDRKEVRLFLQISLRDYYWLNNANRTIQDFKDFLDEDKDSDDYDGDGLKLVDGLYV